MLYDYFSLFLYIIEDLKKSTCIIYTGIESEGSRNQDRTKFLGTIVNRQDENRANNEEESFEIEEELEDIERLLEISKKARALDEKLPSSQKEKNSHLNDLRKDPHVKEFFDNETPNIEDLDELEKGLREARKERKKELAEANSYTNTESSNSNLSELDSLNKKQDYNDYSDYKLDNSLLDYIIDIINKFFN